MVHGHDPREVREYRWRDLELLMILAPVFNPPMPAGDSFHDRI